MSAAVLIVVAVALSRMYRGVHFLTDVLASIAYASAWLAILWASLRPARDAPRHPRDGSAPAGGR